jgi:hypothetical protein
MFWLTQIFEDTHWTKKAPEVGPKLAKFLQRSNIPGIVLHRVSSQNLERNVGMWEGPWKCGIFSKSVGISGKM